MLKFKKISNYEEYHVSNRIDKNNTEAARKIMTSFSLV